MRRSDTQRLDQLGQGVLEGASAHDGAAVGDLVIGLGHGRRDTTGCGCSNIGTMARPYTLAVFTKNRVNPAYAAARLAADRVAAAAGARTLHFVPETPDDVGQQKALVGQALAQAPDAVVFVPVDDRKMVPDVGRITDAGIPVITCINRMDAKVVSFVGSDDVAVGHTVARALIDGLGGKGRIVAIEGTPVAPTSRDRTVGLTKALAEAPVTVRPELRARARDGEVDVEQDSPQHHDPASSNQRATSAWPP